MNMETSIIGLYRGYIGFEYLAKAEPQEKRYPNF